MLARNISCNETLITSSVVCTVLGLIVCHSARSHTFWKSCVLGLRDGEQKINLTFVTTKSPTTTAQIEASNCTRGVQTQSARVGIQPGLLSYQAENCFFQGPWDPRQPVAYLVAKKTQLDCRSGFTCPYTSPMLPR